MCQETMQLLEKIVWVLVQLLRSRRARPRRLKVKVVERVTYQQRYSITLDTLDSD